MKLQSMKKRTKWPLISAGLVTAFLAGQGPARAKPNEEIRVEVSTDASSYTVGENFTVTARVVDAQGSLLTRNEIGKAEIRIKDGGNRKVIFDGLAYSTDGLYTYSYPLSGAYQQGTWEIEVRVEDNAHHRADDEAYVTVLPADNGGDPSPGPSPEPTGDHASITEWKGTATCLGCHRSEAEEVHASPHYQWLGNAAYMNQGPAVQGKMEIGVNSYCINIKGNWNGCGNCHIGLGAKPEATASQAQLENIDCLVCHQKAYRRKKVDGVFVPDTEKMTISMVEAARTVHLPERENCLQCHAKGGGGDNFKRGDMALAHAATGDRSFDVHMATTGADLSCQACHTTTNHLIAGKGSDLRVTELDLEMSCTECHTGKESATGHSTQKINDHVSRVACQTCHIPVYAKDAGDTAASEATEVYRTWLEPHQTASGAIHPTPTMANNLTPEYKWWNKFSTNYFLGAQATVEPKTGRVSTSRPEGAVDDPRAKLYPFKYKAALQPLASARNELIALDTAVFFSTGDAEAATRAGLVNMGYDADEAYEWVETDTYQLLTHEVSPKTESLQCGDCHGGGRLDFQVLGYQLKASQAEVCSQCHEPEDDPWTFSSVHDRHVRSMKYDCSWCHVFSRPERGLRMP